MSEATRRKPTRAQVEEALRWRSSSVWAGVIEPEYRRGYLHALDDVYRWMRDGGAAPWCEEKR